jgi:hypothetical protein
MRGGFGTRLSGYGSSFCRLSEKKVAGCGATIVGFQCFS